MNRVLAFGVVVVSWIALASMTSLAEAGDAKQDFPLRWRYPEVHVIDAAQLQQMLDTVAVVDARTQFEWETLRIKDSVNIPVDEVDTGTNRQFEAGLAKLRKQTTKPIVFYCNGKTCPKSYEAARRAMKAGVTNVYAYDAGIFDWARAHPELTSLYDKASISASDLLDDKEFGNHLLSAKDFKARANSDHCDCLVLDIRDVAQRDWMLFPMREQRVNLDNKAALNAVIEKAKREHKTLLAYDAVGKQVQWLQYYLVKHGVKDYFFMKDGERGYVDSL